MIIKGQFLSVLPIKRDVVATHLNHLVQAILMSTHNICFLWRNKENHPLIIVRYPPYLFCRNHLDGFSPLCVGKSLWVDVCLLGTSMTSTRLD